MSEEDAPKENGFYLAKSKSGYWFTVFCEDGEYAWTSEAHDWKDTPKSTDEFVEWVKVYIER